MLVALVATVGLTATACGASDESSGSNGDTTSSSQLSAADSATDDAKKEPTAITVTTPLDKAPGSGSETIVLAKCDSPQCQQIEEELVKAADAVGWKVKAIPFKSADPATLVAALKQGLEQYDPIAGVVTGSPRAVWEDAAKAYKAAGVPIVAGYVGPMETDDTVIANIGGTEGAIYGEMLANWVISDSKGKGKALIYGVPDFPILKVVDDSFQKTVEEGCSGCSVTVVKGAISEVMSGGAPKAIVSALQRDPSIKYVVTDSGGWAVGLPAALDAAGLDVKIGAQNGNSINLTDLDAGKVNALTGLALRMGSWYMVDAILRHQQGMAMDPEQGSLPTQLMTEDTDNDISDSYDKPADWADQFKKLWQVS
ncbi:sugar ABC transporter substrate-binding protein [Nocardioides marmoriginsengisoli]|nr:substrate-binding domain-containing protein [Nocardioides marmoriginsengisoli]